MPKTETLNLRVSAEFKRRLIEEAKKEKRSVMPFCFFGACSMAIHHSGLKNATTPTLQRRLGNSLKNSAFSSNTRGRASQSGVASGVSNASEDRSSESLIVRQAEGLDLRE